MSLSNSDVAERFARDGSWGRSSRMHIEEDTLYSYRMPIAIRDNGKIIVSNRSRFLGGGSYSSSTSAHINLVWRVLRKYGAKIILVDGDAEIGKDEFFRSDVPPYATFTGLLRQFRDGKTGCWCGIHDYSTGENIPTFHIVNNFLYNTKNVIAYRHSAGECRRRCFWNGTTTKNCDECASRMLCWTSDKNDVPTYIFWLNRLLDTKTKKRCERWLIPYIYVEELNDIQKEY
jgi:hypothetical protein